MASASTCRETIVADNFYGVDQHGRQARLRSRELIDRTPAQFAFLMMCNVNDQGARAAF
jgi:hypothetical protein